MAFDQLHADALAEIERLKAERDSFKKQLNELLEHGDRLADLANDERDAALAALAAAEARGRQQMIDALRDEATVEVVRDALERFVNAGPFLAADADRAADDVVDAIAGSLDSIAKEGADDR